MKLMIGIVYKRIFNKETHAISKKEKFDAIMQIAEDVKNENPKALKNLICALGKPYQLSRIADIFGVSSSLGRIDIVPEALLFNRWEIVTVDEKCLMSIRKKIENEKPLRLAVDLILPWPWNQYGAVNALCHIGTSCIAGKWKQDDNHRVEYWYPMHIGWVFGGNHSLSAGIIKGEGIIETYDTYDVSEIYNYVYCDGKNFISSLDDRIIGPVLNIEFACIFEIGRMIHESNIANVSSKNENSDLC